MTTSPPNPEHELEENPIYLNMITKLGMTFKKKEKEQKDIWK